MTVFHLVRHASYPVLGTTILAGRAPGHRLRAEGQAEAAAVASSLAGRPIRRIVSGPLERARDTAAPLAERLGLPIELAEELDEIDFGEWTGRDWRTLADDPDWAAWHDCRGIAQIPGGETFGAVALRSVALIRELAGEVAAEDEAALFTHADVVRALLASALGLAPELALRIAIDPASRSTLRFDGARPPLVLGVNLPPVAVPR